MNTDTDGHTDHTTRCWWDLHEARWHCDAPEPPDVPLVDVRDMIVVHTAMRREFRLVPDAVAGIEPADTRRARVVDRHLGFLCDLLHHHHAGEDALLWPKLRARVPVRAVRLLDEIEAQHEGIESALQVVGDARERWLASGGTDARDGLVAALRRLRCLLEEHLDAEEGSLLPLAASLLTEAEWKAVGGHAVATMPKPDLVLSLGMFAYEGDPVVLKDMLASAPAVPRVLLPRVGPLVYRRRAAAVYGTARP